jgi:YfiH family protein
MLKKVKYAYQIKELCKENVVCAFSDRSFNYDLRFTSGTKSKLILNNRLKLFRSLKLDLQQAVFLEQIHKTKIKKITSKEKGSGAFDCRFSLSGCDGAFTNIPGVPLVLLTADCLPLIFWQQQHKIIGVAHGGWRGLKAGIAGKIVEKICREFDCTPSGIKVYIGPGIRSCCYEIKQDVGRYFSADIITRNKIQYLDLASIAVRDLVARKIKKENIFDSSLCSRCNKNVFFSYRAGDKKKRMLSVVSLTPCKR